MSYTPSAPPSMEAPMPRDAVTTPLALVGMFALIMSSYVLFGKPVDDRDALRKQEVVHVARR